MQTKYSAFKRTLIALSVALVVISFCKKTEAMIYRAEGGSLWDPSVFYHNGKYHAFMMYTKGGGNAQESRYCLYASSDDGVHWKDERVVLEVQENHRFWKCFVAKCGDRFIMNHGVNRLGKGQDMLSFYESTDLINW